MSTISSMRSQRTSRFRQQQEDEDDTQHEENKEALDNFLMPSSRGQEQSEFFSNLLDMEKLFAGVTQKQTGQKREMNGSESGLTSTRVCILLIERSSELLIPFLDKSDRIKLSQVSIAWNSNIGSFNLFSTIVKSIKEVVNDEVKTSARKTSVKRSDGGGIDPTKQYTSTRQIPQNILRKKAVEHPQTEKKQLPLSTQQEAPPQTPITSSKFSKRFNMISSGGGAGEMERVQTPSTTTSDIESDENQWIRRPPISSLYDPSYASDPQLLLSKLNQKELGIIQDYLELWFKNVISLLDRLRDTVPGEGMIGEVNYWRDLSRILEAINNEIKQSFVEITVQILSISAQTDSLIKASVEQFMKQKSRVIQGTKEAKWNYKYMKIIEKPVTQIEMAGEFKEMQFVIVSLLKSLKNIYENSNFYKEARIVSFIDRLLACILGKLKDKYSIGISIQRGKKEYERYDQDIQIAIAVFNKFRDNFFVAELMLPKAPSIGGSEQDQMAQSFYTKQGIDFLYFARPGTAYGSQAFQQAASNSGKPSFGQTTIQGFYQSDKKTVKPIEMIKSKTQGTSLLTQLWFERAQKVINQLDHSLKLLEFFSYVGLIANRFHVDYIPTLKENRVPQSVIREVTGFLELYTAYQPEYDIYDYKNAHMLALFIENFEVKAQKVEDTIQSALRGDEYDTHKWDTKQGIQDNSIQSSI